MSHGQRTLTYKGKGALINSFNKFEGDFTVVSGGGASFIKERNDTFNKLLKKYNEVRKCNYTRFECVF